MSLPSRLIKYLRPYIHRIPSLDADFVEDVIDLVRTAQASDHAERVFIQRLQEHLVKKGATRPL